MKNPNSDTDEKIILDSSSISIKGIKFRVILTNFRIALVNASTQKQNDILLPEVQKVRPESGLIGDPIILLSILSKSGENKKMIFNFSPGRETERNQWITEINKLIMINEKNFSNAIKASPVNSDVLDQQSYTFFCSRCGNKVIDDSLFCNHCGAKIIPPIQPGLNNNNDKKLKFSEGSPKISNEKITLPSRKTQYADINTSYVKPKESRNTPIAIETIRNKFIFSLPTGSNQKTSVAALCCGGLILLIVISAIFSSITNGSAPSNAGTNSMSGSTSSGVSVTTVKSSEPSDVLDLYLYTYQNVGTTFPMKITGIMLYDYLSKNVTSTTSKEQVGIVVSSVRTQWKIFDYTIGKTEKRGKYATVTADIIWQTPSGIQVSRTKQISFVFEDNKWKLDEFFYSM